MNEQYICELLKRYKEGQITEETVVSNLKKFSINTVDKLGFAEVDHHRELRQGFPEVIYSAGKTKEQVLAIMQSLYEHGEGNIMATRASLEQFEFVVDKLPAAKYDEMARIIYIDRNKKIVRDEKRTILIMTAGTSDIPVAEEARLTAYLWGNHVKACYDCGVAGIHRLLNHIEDIESANVLIVVAGMEGALASVVGGLTDKPVIAVPTSVGYGASFHGLAALLSMLNSCASGVSVVNIDNGFGAGVLASKINRLR